MLPLQLSAPLMHDHAQPAACPSLMALSMCLPGCSGSCTAQRSVATPSPVHQPVHHLSPLFRAPGPCSSQQPRLRSAGAHGVLRTQVWTAFLDEVCGDDEEKRQAMREERDAKREAFATELGHHVRLSMRMCMWTRMGACSVCVCVCVRVYVCVHARMDVWMCDCVQALGVQTEGCACMCACLCVCLKKRVHAAMQVMAEVSKALAAMRADGPLRDHRPLQCNADDYLRMVAVPSHKHACFRQMPGVVTNEDSEWEGWPDSMCVRESARECMAV